MSLLVFKQARCFFEIDFYIDESVIVPKTSAAVSSNPEPASPMLMSVFLSEVTCFSKKIEKITD